MTVNPVKSLQLCQQQWLDTHGSIPAPLGNEYILTMVNGITTIS